MGHLSGPVNVPVKNGELDEVVGGVVVVGGGVVVVGGGVVVVVDAAAIVQAVWSETEYGWPGEESTLLRTSTLKVCRPAETLERYTPEVHAAKA
jgi:hypothetical protein